MEGSLSPVFFTFSGYTVVFCVSLFLYFFYEREKYIFFWCAAWFLNLIRFAADLAYSYNSLDWWSIISNFAMLGNTVAILMAIYSYGKRKLSRWTLSAGLVYIFIFTYFIALVFPYPEKIKIWFMFLSGAVNLVTGYLLLRYFHQGKKPGVLLTGWTLILWGVHKFDYPLISSSNTFLYSLAFMVSGMFATVLAVGIIMIIFDDLKQHSEKSLQNMVISFSSLIDARDPYTAEHSLMVAYYARSLAERIGLSEHQANDIFLAGQLHDIGKIGVPDHILNKKDKLTEEEKKIINRHVLIGWKTLKDTGVFEHITDYVRHHHEWFNGQGYPDGTAGEEIPLGARILSIADSYDAMVSNRPYRKALSQAEACQELLRCKGSQFSPELVDAFVEIIRQEENNHQGATVSCSYSTTR